MKYLKKFNESESDDKFTSRLDGGEMSKSDFEKRGDFWKPKSMSDDDFDTELKSTMGEFGEGFRGNIETPSDLVLKLLKTCWNTDESILKSVAEYFKSFDYANHFMNEYDAHGEDMETAWDSFVNRYDWDSDESNPFNEKFNEKSKVDKVSKKDEIEDFIGKNKKNKSSYEMYKVLREKGYGEKDLKDYFYDNY
jgi:hypothetical protein